MSRAVDLSALKARADASRTPSAPGPGGGGSPSTSASEFVIDTTEETFGGVVEQSLQVPVVVALYASWSPQSMELVQTAERLAARSRGTWLLAKVDVDASPRIAQTFGAQSVPMLIAVAAGQPVDGLVDVLPEPELKQWIDRLVTALRDRMPGIAAAEQNNPAEGDAPEVEPEPEPEDPRLIAAEDALERGDYAEAEAAYQQILDAEPTNEEVKAALAQVRFIARAESADPSAVATADANPDDLDAQFAAADVELAEQRIEDAFRRLIDTVRRTAGEDRDRVRSHLVELFGLFPADDPMVTAARRNLASALF
jgi:putative thioredoxin